jgi:hypothetical protein
VLVVAAALVGALAAVLLARGGDTSAATTTVATTTVATTVTVGSTNATTTAGSAPPRSGVVTVVRHVGPFSGVNLAAANVVHVRVGAPTRVIVTAERTVVPLVTTTVRAGVLVISRRGRYTTHALHVEVTTPTLSSVALDGSGRLTVDGVRGPRFAASLGGSGVLRATGRTDALRAQLGGVGDVDLGEVTAARAQAALSGSGRMTLTVTGSLQAALSGKGSIVYGGSPGNVSTRVTGNGTITSR